MIRPFSGGAVKYLGDFWNAKRAQVELTLVLGLQFLIHMLLNSILPILMASAFALPPMPKKVETPQAEKLPVHKVYTLQEQEMDTVNWVYLGFAPRMQDPKRIRLILSKQGFTMRVNFEMTAEEVADYPAYLKRRLTSIDQVIFRKRSNAYLNIKQIQYYMDFMDTVEQVSAGSDLSSTYGFNALKKFFPENVRQVTCSFDSSKTCVEGNFVYPITIHRDGMMASKDGKRITVPMKKATPQASTYYTQIIEERRSAHYEYFDDGPLKGHRTGNVQDHLFNGFPAFWFKTAAGTKGQGIHGPIRFSSAREKQGVVQEDYMNDPWYWDGVNPLYRFDVVRTANSEGCIRSEPMEMRHMLPSDYNLVLQVPIQIINEIDLFDEDRDGVGDLYIDVDYYVENHYKSQDKKDWYLKHYISFEERQEAQKYGISVEDLLAQKLESTKVFPYLHPRAVEFQFMIKDSFGYSYPQEAPDIMKELNRSPKR